MAQRYTDRSIISQATGILSIPSLRPKEMVDALEILISMRHGRVAEVTSMRASPGFVAGFKQAVLSKDK